MIERSWCQGRAVLGLALAVAASCGGAARADDWPQWLGPQRDGVWREDGILDKFPQDGPKVLWRTPIGSGYAGPAVAGDRVYITDRVLDEGQKNPANGFAAGTTTGRERVLCLSEASGEVLWTHEYPCEYRIMYPSGPRTTPLIADGKVYALGAMGDLRCLNAADGQLHWSRNFVKDYGAKVLQWGFTAHPLLDGDRLITLVGGDGSVAVAFHKDTGKEIWRSLSSASIGYAPPVIGTVGARRQLIIWHSEAACGLEPESGKPLWEERTPRMKSDLSVSMPRLFGDRLFITSFYNSAMMLKLSTEKPAAEVLWKGKSSSEQPDRTDTLHSIMPTPIVKDGYIYGICSYGQLRCLKAETGERVWQTMEATRARVNGQMVPADPKPRSTERWGNAFLVPQGDRCLLFNEKGDLIIAHLSPAGYQEVDRARILEADNPMPGRPVVWSHPAFAHRKVLARNDHEIVCVSLAK